MVPNAEQGRFIQQFQKERGVSLFDPDSLTDEDWDAYYQGLEELEKKYGESDNFEEKPDDFFKIKVNMYTLDGLKQSVTDVRELSLEKLSDLIQEFPQYAGYYAYRLFKK